MDFLLDPNVAYLILLGGFLLGMLSLATPGTGFFEVGALFCIALAGYAVYNLSFIWWALLILILSLAVFIYAIQKPKREMYLGVSILLLVFGSVFLFPGAEGSAIAVNPVVATLASSLVAGFLWIASRKSMEAAFSRPTHDLEALIGQVGEARTDVYEEGSVQVGRELWSAQSDTLIPAGSTVRVLRRNGFFVVVEQVRQSNS
jgi:membrane-bound serine protease (ClpP class)